MAQAGYQSKKKAAAWITLGMGLVVVVAAGFVLVFQQQPVEAGSGDNVSGWAWSENTGWLSFNCTDPGTCPPPVTNVDYGVNVDTGSGNFSGGAWSDHVGWISFNGAETGPTPDGFSCGLGCIASLNFGTKEVSGWGRALSACKNDLWDGTKCTGVGAGDAAGGWDGWIKFRDAGPPAYGVTWNNTTDEFEGWAWGGDVVGWVSFNNKDCDADEDGFSDGTPPGCPAPGTPIPDYQVVFDDGNSPPSATALTVTPQDYCGTANPPIVLSWTFSDPDLPSDAQSAYQVQVDDEPSFSLPLFINTPKIVTPGNIYAPPGLAYNTTYYWRVKVWDSSDAESLWAVGPSFTTATHAAPNVSFTPSPSNPAAGTLVTFTDSSTCYDSTNTLYDCKNDVNNRYQWDFDYPSGVDCDSGTGLPSPCRGDVTHTYTSVASGIVVRLDITDDLFTCDHSETLNVVIPFPDWEEISPL